ncbi:hypothetical protein [Streptomyces sp. NPDC058424]|uniref:hypothetical protein n=1 Tax=Streptomyces sp. NPDC058424 TaxID=3346491 RepID=UPI003645FECB
MRSRDPVSVVPVVGCFGGIWALVNIWLRRRLFTVPLPYPYWLVCVTATLAPYFVGVGIG